MWQLLNQPYPCEDPVRRRWAKAFWIGVFVGLFLLIFQPFGLNTWNTPYKTLKILGFGLISLLVTAGLSLSLPVLLPKQFSNDRWTVGREILWITTHMTLIGLANYFYINWLTGSAIYSSGLFGMIIVTFVIGVFPSAGTVLVNYIVKLKRYQQLAREFPVREHHAGNPADGPDQRILITLTAENEKDSLVFPPTDLLYIESSDNYSTIVHLKNGQPVKTLLRSSLSRLESQLGANDPSITARNPMVRCHRSYIVNLEKVERVTGNAQGYKLHLQDGLFQIPVARKYNDTLVAQLKSMV
ncbi:LytTR family DNA-binding domain-containing protein [Larkinella knui]|uniref:LytTR family transcriptional regulator n=1 Tax=Larkinella knui TaxID=2025310 RepID=A0A3P1CC80_9BACT|nr:LytTR family DNA-binding domain-containing protein [Larkinella knui]RRB10921.1 LytTR family transcriptional regulator [Larkinella knui]